MAVPNPVNTYILKWNNHLSNLSEVFLNMLTSENMVDVTIACEGATIKAHKVVLSACSPFFHQLFLSNPCKHPIIILSNVRYSDLKAIIDFMYRGEVNVSQSDLSLLLKLAETLQVKGLAEVTEKQARGQPQMQSALCGAGTGGNSSRRKRKRNKKSVASGHKQHSAGESSESDDENTAPSKRHLEAAARAAAQQRLTSTPRSTMPMVQNEIIDKESGSTLNTTATVAEQMEPSRILAESLATAEVGASENGPGVLGADVVPSTLTDDVAMRGDHVLFDGDGMDGGTIMALPGPSTMQATPATIIVFGQGAGATSTSAANAIAKTNNNQRSPSGVGKFECTMCSLRFASNYNLKRHARIHDTERPRWQCDFCDKSFTRRDSLPKHINFVHKDQAALVPMKDDELSITPTSPGSTSQPV